MCYRPITIKNPASGQYMKVPCGKCLDCLRRYQNDWSIRMFEEYKARGCKGVFFTLTYDEAHVPKNYFVDGSIFRSSPDYGYGNVRPDKGYGLPKCGHGVRRKYAEAPHACLSRAGVLRDDCYECNSEILNFNEKRSLSKHRAFLSHLQRLFTEYFSLCSLPSGSILVHNEQSISFEEIEKTLNIQSVTDDVVKSFKVDEDTGELIAKADYDSPVAELFSYRERPIVCFNSVRKEDVQLWLKRNWTRWSRSNPGRKISHFITSEYGPSTLRPHYHGCFFGATAEELKPWFKDWQEHYGVIVDFADLDMTKGGLSYVSKYCSKGSFEHPLCAKDFFYFFHRASDYSQVVCSEYHSKHYEKCIQWFGVDMPIVDPTFHLISKGLGVDWCKNDVPRCKEFEVLASLEQEPVFSFDDFIEGRISVDDLLVSYKDSLNIRDENKKKWLEFHDNGATVEAWLRAFSERNCYRRNFVSAEGEKVIAYALPKYYREKMFGPNLRAAYPNYVQSCSDEDFRQKLRQMDSDFDSREDSEKVMALCSQERQELVDRFNRCVDKYKRFYSKSKL